MTSIEKRAQYRLPFHYPIIVTHPNYSFTGYSSNISKGGIFVSTMLDLPVGDKVKILFKLPEHPTTLCLNAIITHRILEEQKCEIDCGIGLKFDNIPPKQQSLINLHMLNEKEYYFKLHKILSTPLPSLAEIKKWVEKLPHLKHMDIIELKYKVDRVCLVLEKFEFRKKNLQTIDL